MGGLHVLVVAEDATSVASDLRRVREGTATAAYSHILVGPFPREEAAQRWASYSGTVYVAVVDGVTVGFAACSEEVLDALYVLPEARGQGVGSRLLAALPQARQLWVLQRNDGARHFYERRGWQISGE